MSESKEYRAWANAKARCYRKTHPRYADWGGRGITMSDDWRTHFASFLRDMGPKPTPLHILDRRDNDGPYSKENCQWVLPSQSSYNRRTFKSNKQKIRCVSWDRNSAIAYAHVNKKRIILYYGPDFFEACCARKSYEVKEVCHHS
jgi:hypothetical protein